MEEAEDILLLPMDSNSYLPGLIPDPLSFALDAVPKVQVVVAKCPTNQPEPDAFIYILGSLLVDVHAHLDKIQDTEGSPSDTTKRKILLVLDALEVLVNVSTELPLLLHLQASIA